MYLFSICFEESHLYKLYVRRWYQTVSLILNFISEWSFYVIFLFEP